MRHTPYGRNFSKYLNTVIWRVQYSTVQSVLVATNFGGVEPHESIERWDRTKKEQVPVKRPNAIVLYNKSMGGTDLFDMSSFYRIDHQSKKILLAFILLGPRILSSKRMVALQKAS